MTINMLRQTCTYERKKNNKDTKMAKKDKWNKHTHAKQTKKQNKCENKKRWKTGKQWTQTNEQKRFYCDVKTCKNPQKEMLKNQRNAKW